MQTVDMNAPLNEALKARLLKQKGVEEGTSCGNSLRLLSYCRKHVACASELDFRRPASVAVTSLEDSAGMVKLSS